MAKKNYEQLAKEVVDKVGGIENINSLFHCVTRLRFKLKETSKADKESIKNIKGVLTVVEGNGCLTPDAIPKQWSKISQNLSSLFVGLSA